jgi:hypothetical protein
MLRAYRPSGAGPDAFMTVVSTAYSPLGYHTFLEIETECGRGAASLKPLLAREIDARANCLTIDIVKRGMALRAHNVLSKSDCDLGLVGDCGSSKEVSIEAMAADASELP